MEKFYNTLGIIWRIILWVTFISAIGFGITKSWFFWNWHWTGIVLFFAGIIQVLIVALVDYGVLPKDDEETDDRNYD